MKAVIVTPPVEDFYFTPRRAAALGARALERELHSHEVRAVVENLPLRGRPRIIQIPGELSYLEAFIIPNETGPLSWFTAYRRFGPDAATAADIVADHHPEVVLFSSFAWGYAEEARNTARAVARTLPELPLVIGGHGPASLPEFFLEAPHPVYPDRPLFSLVVAGEVEGHGSRILDLMRDPGTRFVDVRDGPNPEAWPPTVGGANQTGEVLTLSAHFTRGCPRRCRFCSNHLAHGRSFRVTPREEWNAAIDRQAEEARQYQEFGRLHINVEDDNILFIKGDFYRFLATEKARRPATTFSAENGLDYDLLTRGDLERLKELGFIHLHLSLGILTEEGRSAEDRHGDPDHLADLLVHADEIGLPTTTHFISGFSGDDPDAVVRTLLFLDALPTRTGLSNFYPVPGLPGFENKNLFLRKDPHLALGSSIHPWTGSLTTEQMLTAFRLARWSNFRKNYRNGNKAEPVETELHRRIRETRRIHTVIKGKHVRRVVPVEHLDEEMVESFFAAADKQR